MDVILYWRVNQVIHRHIKVILEVLKYPFDSLFFKAHVNKILYFNWISLPFLLPLFMSALSFNLPLQLMLS